MALSTSLAINAEKSRKMKPINTKRRKKHQHPPPSQPPPPQPPPSAQSSWDQIKNLITCKQMEASRVHEPAKRSPANSKLGSSCSSICRFRDVVHGNAKIVHRPDNSPETSSLGQETRLLTTKATNGSSSRSLTAPTRTKNGASASYSSSRGLQLRKLSGCYECHTIVDPSRYPIPRSSICPCPQCGEMFPKIESLELHQAVRHAVSELGPDDSGRNIVEIIFKSSWLKIDRPICKIERILKVHNTQRTIQRFEDCRDAVKTRALACARKNPRCAADGNELLRFHCSELLCDLGSRGSTGLCGSIPGCRVCSVIRHGFQCKPGEPAGVRTTASSGRAHDSFECGDGRRRAMLVCRVIAGRVKRIAEDLSAAAVEEENLSAAAASYDSVSRQSGKYSNLEELIIFNPKAILPCFVVIYEALQT
ncbi:uncharacterized protein LOC111446039 [Cucurbita moschata]|uniref:Uncharacterized protein LOC111446039 n=1 Tax=Cucurbita moschata TaxID=3662 RepID=A0A6J1FJK3_CUCMO|nr:uncharacterized protein LOC111446039 [Cucurbita moschata]